MSTPDVTQILHRIRGESSPYLTSSEAHALLPWLSTAIDSGDAWAMWIRGRIADSNLLPREPSLALALWQRGHALGSAPCTFELGHRAERSMDRDHAIPLYETAAAAGFAPAAIRRGHIAARLAFSETWRLGRDEIETLRDEAERWYRRAIELGRQDAWADVAFTIRCRPGVTDEDMSECARHLARATEAAPADLLSRVFESVGNEDGNTSLAPHELAALSAWVTSTSDGDDTWAIWLHGVLADSGTVPGGAVLALSLWERGAELGGARCAFRLGLRVEKKKKKEATALYERSAAGGFGLAALRLGHLAKTWKDAERWYRRAVELGRTDAWLDIARLLTSGAKGAPVDREEAARCWERAAEGGGAGPVAVAAEMFDTGVFEGQSIGRDPVKARRFAERGLDLSEGGGVPRCQFVMAKLLAAGEGGPVDREGAALLSRIAGRRADHVSESARALHAEIWATLDDAARLRVLRRDEELNPGIELGALG